MEKIDNKRFVSIDLLKVICAVWVIMNHSPFSNEQMHSLYFSFWVYQAVPIFTILMGFNLYNSCKRKTDIGTHYELLYSKKNFLPRMLRLFIPYVIAMIIQGGYLVFVENASYSISDWVSSWLRGGFGTGGYYTAIYLQAIVLFPILYVGLHEKAFITTATVLAISIVWELLVRGLELSDELYRCAIFRLLLALCMGGGASQILRKNKANSDSLYHVIYREFLFAVG